MGQAFDRDGNVLGEAYGDTKREVFDELMGRFKDAAEIRIKTTEGVRPFNASGGAQVEMPRYRCHKEVWALKIKDIKQAPADVERMHAGGDWYLIPEDARYGAIVIGHYDYYVRHKPTVGGYYVVYKDGYESFSPAEAFEDGYSLI